MICYLSRNYKGINNAANKAKTDIESVMATQSFRNVGVKQTRYTNIVAAFFYDTIKCFEMWLLFASK